mmetsp:Transcript_20535/g.43807  ORF Transcript_20535/g.43807 Transcript_20535/m.43807 type:complete len:254 (-) Transcript_20535:371-1132(-)
MHGGRAGRRDERVVLSLEVADLLALAVAAALRRRLRRLTRRRHQERRAKNGLRFRSRQGRRPRLGCCLSGLRSHGGQRPEASELQVGHRRLGQSTFFFGGRFEDFGRRDGARVGDRSELDLHLRRGAHDWPEDRLHVCRATSTDACCHEHSFLHTCRWNQVGGQNIVRACLDLNSSSSPRLDLGRQVFTEGEIHTLDQLLLESCGVVFRRLLEVAHDGVELVACLLVRGRGISLRLSALNRVLPANYSQRGGF